MKRGTTAKILTLLVLAAGCRQAKQVRVTYESDPPGGILYKRDGELWGPYPKALFHGEPWGPCPKALWYDLDAEAVKNGYLEVKGLVVRWPDGSEKRSGDLIRIRVDGTERRVVFTKPKLATNAVRVASE